MALVFEDRQAGGPSTHVLAIGIGSYPHLIGGGGELALLPARMRQLRSPPASARAFADWVVGRFDNPGRPLATVELLLDAGQGAYALSPRGGVQGPQVAVGGAGLADISRAAVSWKARATHPDDLMLFYFCGHGLSKGAEFAVVAEDYGADRANPLTGLVDVGKFLLGMQDCIAREQCFFIDACRASDESLVDAEDYGHALVQKWRAPTPALAQCVYYSTLGGETAHGRKGRPSYYTDALLRALAGAGASNAGGEWWVNSTRLFEALSHLLREVSNASTPRVQVPQSGSQVMFDLHRVHGLPELPLTLGIDGHRGFAPPQSVASLRLRQAGKTLAAFPPATPPTPHACEWRDRHFEAWLPFGETNVEVVKAGTGTRSESVWLVPPGMALKGW